MIEEKLTAVLRTMLPQVFPRVSPDGAKSPFLIYNTISKPRENTIEGDSGIAYPVIRVDIYHLSFKEAKLLVKQVRTAVLGMRDEEVMAVVCTNELDNSDLTTDPNLSRITVEFRFTIRD